MGYGVWADFVHAVFHIGVVLLIVQAIVGLFVYMGTRLK